MNIPPTPFEFLRNISNLLSTNIYIKRDDLFPLVGGGNKARKLNYILNQNIQKKHNAIVTAGSNQSNHLRSTALFASKLGWKLICIIHDNEKDKYEGNLKIVKLTGAELRFVQMHEVKEAMAQAMNDLIKEGYNPLYIWGGGHCLNGSLAYYDAVLELKSQMKSIKPDYIFVASGTGTTQAGIEMGVSNYLQDCKVIGISISREKKRGKEIIMESMKELSNYLGRQDKMPEEIVFDTNWLGSGYEKTYPELLATIRWAAKTEGLLLDPTYTGKAFHALIKYIKEREIEPNSNVVFWHTGGLLNLIVSNDI